MPLSLFTEEGLMLSCKKSDFMHKLEELGPEEKINNIDTCDAIIFDGHAIIEMLHYLHNIQINISGHGCKLFQIHIAKIKECRMC